MSGDVVALYPLDETAVKRIDDLLLLVGALTERVKTLEDEIEELRSRVAYSERQGGRAGPGQR